MGGRAGRWIGGKRSEQRIKPKKGELKGAGQKTVARNALSSAMNTCFRNENQQ